MSFPVQAVKKKHLQKKKCSSKSSPWTQVYSRSNPDAFISRGQTISVDDNNVMILGTPTSKEAGTDYGRWCEFTMHLPTGKIKRVKTTLSKPDGRRGHSCIKVDDKVYVLGGWDSKAQFNDMYSLDLPTLKWTSHGSMLLSHRSGHAVAAVKDGFVIHGGAACEGGYYKFMRDAFYYSTVTHQMLMIPASNSYPPGRAQHGMVFNEETNELFIFGGLKQSRLDTTNGNEIVDNRLNDVWVTELTYDTGSYYAEGWRKLPPMPFKSFYTPAKPFRSPQASRGVFVRNNCFYVYGGEQSYLERPDYICQFNMKRKVWRKIPQRNPPEFQAISGLVSGNTAILSSWSYVNAKTPNKFWLAPADVLLGPSRWTQKKHQWFPKEQRFPYRCLLFFLSKSDELYPGSDICDLIAKFFMDSEYFEDKSKLTIAAEVDPQL